MAQIDKLLVMGCKIRRYTDANGNIHYTLWSDDYKIELQFIHESTFKRYESRLYKLQSISIPTGECYEFFRLVRQ